MIGTEIKEARLAAGLGLRETARALPLSAAYLCGIECGERLPSPAVIVKLAAAIGTAPDRWLWLWAVEQMTEPLATLAARYTRQQRREARQATTAPAVAQEDDR